MKKLRLITAIAAIAFTLLLTMCSRSPSSNANSQMAVRIKDAPSFLCQKADIEIKGIQVYSSTQGWVTIPVRDTIMDILQLHDTSALLAMVNLDPGVITQVRVTLGLTDSIEVDGIDWVLNLTSSDFIIRVNDTVTANGAFTLIVDINAAESIWDDDNDGVHHHFSMNGSGACDFRRERNRF